MQLAWTWIWENIQSLDSLLAIMVVFVGVIGWIWVKVLRKTPDGETSPTGKVTIFKRKVKVKGDFVQGDKVIHGGKDAG